MPKKAYEYSASGSRQVKPVEMADWSRSSRLFGKAKADNVKPKTSYDSSADQEQAEYSDTANSCSSTSE